jgi:hypothetical protein
MHSYFIADIPYFTAETLISLQRYLFYYRDTYLSYPKPKIYTGTSVADPGFGAFLTPGSGMGKIRIRIRDEHPRLFSRSSGTVFWVENT